MPGVLEFVIRSCFHLLYIIQESFTLCCDFSHGKDFRLMNLAAKSSVEYSRLSKQYDFA